MTNRKPDPVLILSWLIAILLIVMLVRTHYTLTH